MLMLWVPESVDKVAASSHLPLLLTHLRDTSVPTEI